MSRNTIKKYLNAGTIEPKFSVPERPSKLDPYADKLIRHPLKGRVGVISDTHGVLRPEALDALKGVAHILHAGDIGNPEHLDDLARLAPVTAIRGNIDRGPWADTLPDTATLTLEDLCIHMIHDRKALRSDPEAEGWDVVISGHSHKPDIDKAGATLWLNPGAAGPRRFRLPVTLALLWREAGHPRAEIQTLPV